MGNHQAAEEGAVHGTGVTDIAVEEVVQASGKNNSTLTTKGAGKIPAPVI